MITAYERNDQNDGYDYNYLILLLVLGLSFTCFATARLARTDIKLYNESGRKKRAKMISFEKRRERCDGKDSTYHTYYDLTIEYQMDDGSAKQETITTENRKAKKYKNKEYVDIVTIDDELNKICPYYTPPVIEEDKATRSKVILYDVVGSIILVLLIISIIGIILDS